MLAGQLAYAVKIASKVSNSTALIPLYRSIEIGPDSVRACSEHGNIEVATEETGIKEPVLVEAVRALGVFTSVKENAELILEVKDNQLHWKCQDAKGALSLVEQDIQIPKIRHEDFPWVPKSQSELSDAVMLAVSACQAATVSVGLFGVVFEPEGDNLKMSSSNSVSLASAKVPLCGFPKDKITLRPPVPHILAFLLRVTTNAALDLTKDGLFIVGDNLIAKLPRCEPIAHDLNEVLDKFKSFEHFTAIDANGVRKFLVRARALADKHIPLNVSISVNEGRIVLQHKGMVAESEEFFLAQGIDEKLTFESVTVPVNMLVVPLEHVEAIVLDYLPDNTLLLRGENPEFTYIIGGG